jgi:hypothetical protein
VQPLASQVKMLSPGLEAAAKGITGLKYVLPVTSRATVVKGMTPEAKAAAPCGMVKFSTAALAVPAFVTEAAVPAAPVVTVPMVMVAGVPAVPAKPVGPVEPLGMVKLKTAALAVPEFVTEADVPAAPVVVVPALTVAGEPIAPLGPVAPTGPVGPAAPVAPVGPVAPAAARTLQNAGLTSG